MASTDGCGIHHAEAVSRHRCAELQRISRGLTVLIARSTRSRRFACRTLSCPMAILACCGVTHAAHAESARTPRGELASAETVIAVEAGEHAPRLTTLSLRGATAWKNRAEEVFPEDVEVRGEMRHLQWRLDRSASRFESK